MNPRDELVFTIAFALRGCTKRMLKEMAQSHGGDEARKRAAELVLKQLKLSGYRIRNVTNPEAHMHRSAAGKTRG